jgi:hypothetical protein
MIAHWAAGRIRAAWPRVISATTGSRLVGPFQGGPTSASFANRANAARRSSSCKASAAARPVVAWPSVPREASFA